MFAEDGKRHQRAKLVHVLNSHLEEMQTIECMFA